MPTRAVTGHNWTGHELNFSRAPKEYGGIHFHDDDLEMRAGKWTFNSSSRGDEERRVRGPAYGREIVKITFPSSSGQRRDERPPASRFWRRP